MDGYIIKDSVEIGILLIQKGVDINVNIYDNSMRWPNLSRLKIRNYEIQFAA